MKQSIYFFSLLLMASLSWASGSTGGSGGGGQHYEQRPVDPVYESGKSIFSGRNKTYGKIKICIADKTNSSAEKLKIKSKTLKPYKGGSYQELANNLYECGTADVLVGSLLSEQDLAYVTYYLDKRFRLKLDLK